MLPLLGSQVQPLVRELRSQKWCSLAKKRERNRNDRNVVPLDRKIYIYVQNKYI